MAPSKVTTGIVNLFTNLSAIPHGSGQEAALAEEIARQLTQLGGVCQQDPAGNLRCDLPATPGRGSLPLLCLQGHLDMVCTAALGSDYRPKEEGIHCRVLGDYLRSDGRSSLGADNLLGVSALLFLLKDGAPHGPLRLILTVEEEVGLKGALQVSPRWMDGVAYLINVDGFSAQRCIISSAGSVRQYWSRPLERRSTGLGAWKLTLYRFPGGHSGSDIGKNRPNPLKLIASLIAQCDGEISSLSGGQAMNAIPDHAEALLCLRDPETLHKHLAALPPVGKWSLTPMEGAVTVWDEWSRQAALDFLLSLPNGVQNWRADLPEVPAASTCVVLASSTEDTLTIGTHVRAAHTVVLERTANGAALHAQRCGFTLANSHSYPPWEGEADSPFVQAMVQAYRQANGIDPEVTAVHVGLEPGVLLSQHPEIPAISIGPTILNPHSVREYADLSQLPRFSRFLARLLSGEWMWDL